jgi:hypothetical protein
VVGLGDVAFPGLRFDLEQLRTLLGARLEWSQGAHPGTGSDTAGGAADIATNRESLMKPDSPRAQRRHRRWRMVQRALRLFRMWDAPKGNVLDERGLHKTRRAHDPERLADNLRPCACRACTSTRREFAGPTLRERRADAPHV